MQYLIPLLTVLASVFLVDAGPQVRIVYGGGGHRNQGNAEVFYNKRWHRICSQGWADVEATVLCNQAGFPGPAIAAPAGFFKIRDNLPWGMSRVRCTGTEAEILDCRHDSEVTGCSDGDEAGVYCNGAEPLQVKTRGALRLIGSQNPGEGNLQVSIGSQFGKVCSRGWRDVEADLVCRELGFSGGKATRGAFFGSNPRMIFHSLPFLFDQVRCDGSESTVYACRMSLDVDASCTNGDEAGAVCNGTPHPIRLRGGANALEGNVEILIGARWGRVCDKSWGQEEAQLACNQLGHTGNAQPIVGNPFVRRPRLTFYDFRCRGGEQELFDCIKSLEPGCEEGSLEAAVICRD